MRSDPLVALPRPFAISGGGVAVGARAPALADGKLRPAKCIEGLGGSIMHRCGGVVDRCRAEKCGFDARHSQRLRPGSDSSNRQIRETRVKVEPFCSTFVDRFVLECG
jgi:hypothetical protein